MDKFTKHDVETFYFSGSSQCKTLTLSHFERFALFRPDINNTEINYIGELPISVN